MSHLERAKASRRANSLAQLALSMEGRGELDRPLTLRRQALALLTEALGPTYAETLFAKHELELSESAQRLADARLADFAVMQRLKRDWQETPPRGPRDGRKSIADQGMRLAEDLFGADSAERLAWACRVLDSMPPDDTAIHGVASILDSVSLDIHPASVSAKHVYCSIATGFLFLKHVDAEEASPTNDASRKAAAILRLCRDSRAFGLYQALGDRWREQHDYQRAESAFDTSLDAALARFEAEDSPESRYNVAAAYSSLAGLAHDRFDFAAEASHWERAADFVDSSPANSPVRVLCTPFARQELAEVYLKLCRYGDAVLAVRQLEDDVLSQEALRAECLITALETYAIVGDFKEATRVAELIGASQGASATQQRFDVGFVRVDRTRPLSLRLQTAIAQSTIRRHEGRAIDAVALLEAFHRDDDRATPVGRAMLCLALAAAYRDAGNFSRSMEMTKEVERLLPEPNLDGSNHRWELRRERAETLAALEEFDRADAALRDALAAANLGCGRDHPDYARCELSLAKLRIRQSRPAEAEPLVRDALTIYEQVGCEAYPIYGDALDFLCEVLRLTGRNSEAKAILARRSQPSSGSD